MRGHSILWTVVILGLAPSAALGEQSPGRLAAMEEPLPTAVRVQGDFWSPKLNVYVSRTIPYSWPFVTPSIDDIRNASTPERTPAAKNQTWAEANLHKHLESVAFALAQWPDEQLAKRVDTIVDSLAAMQKTSDGFVHAYVLNRKKDQPWGKLLSNHDEYITGHMIEAAVAYYRATGKRNFLDVACKAADQAYRHFVVGKKEGILGHAEFKMALVELYRVTGNRNYLDLARYFIDQKGRRRYVTHAYYQDDLPVSEMSGLNGHAVRAVFFATGVADVAIETADPALVAASRRLWASASQRRMYVTGSIGSYSEGEAIGNDFELPARGYCESCANCAMVNFAHRMLRMDGDARAADELERALYNSVLHGVALSGCAFYYCNPESDRNHRRGDEWCCCPATVNRTLLGVGRYAYGVSGDDVHVNLFVGGSARLATASGTVALDVATAYPWKGSVEIAVKPDRPHAFALRVRIPGWCRGAKLAVGGRTVDRPKMEKGYAVLERTWKTGDTVSLEMPMPVVRIEAHPRVEAARGKVAIQRGPLVYGVEGLDNENRQDIALPVDPQFQIEHRADLLGGVTVIRGVTADGKPLLAIPFHAMANRDATTQEVWLKQVGKPIITGWQGPGWEARLYRPYDPAAQAKKP